MCPRGLKLMPDYGCSPLWHHNGDAAGPIDTTELPLSAEVRTELAGWAAWYDTWIDLREPYDSRTVLEEEERAFWAAGRRLWRALRAELGSSWRVVYCDDGAVVAPEEDTK